LLEGEVALVRDQQGKLLLMIRAAARLFERLHHHDSAFHSWLLAERSSLAGEPVIGHIDPFAGRRVSSGGSSFVNLFLENAHAMKVSIQAASWPVAC
jgi:hypothetical protein